MPADRFALTNDEKAGHLWLRLKAHMIDCLNVARDRNERVDLTENETAALRGEMKILRQFIRLGDDRPMTGE